MNDPTAGELQARVRQLQPWLEDSARTARICLHLMRRVPDIVPADLAERLEAAVNELAAIAVRTGEKVRAKGI